MNSLSFLVNLDAQKLQLLTHEQAIGRVIIDYQYIQGS